MFETLSVLAILSYFVPLAIVAVKELWKDNFFMLFAIYWALGGIVNMCDVLPFVSKNLAYQAGVIYNMIDIPVILSILYCTSASKQVKRMLPYAAAVIIAMEVVGIFMQGFDYDAFKYSLGVGIISVIAVVVSEIICYMQRVENSNRQTAKAFVYAAVLFEYATFIVIYIFDYYIETTGTVDSYLIYYFSTLVAIVIASCGYLLSRKYEPNPIGL